MKLRQREREELWMHERTLRDLEKAAPKQDIDVFDAERINRLRGSVNNKSGRYVHIYITTVGGLLLEIAADREFDVRIETD